MFRWLLGDYPDNDYKLGHILMGPSQLELFLVLFLSFGVEREVFRPFPYDLVDQRQLMKFKFFELPFTLLDRLEEQGKPPGPEETNYILLKINEYIYGDSPLSDFIDDDDHLMELMRGCFYAGDSETAYNLARHASQEVAPSVLATCFRGGFNKAALNLMREHHNIINESNVLYAFRYCNLETVKEVLYRYHPENGWSVPDYEEMLFDSVYNKENPDVFEYLYRKFSSRTPMKLLDSAWRIGNAEVLKIINATDPQIASDWLRSKAAQLSSEGEAVSTDSEISEDSSRSEAESEDDTESDYD